MIKRETQNAGSTGKHARACSWAGACCIIASLAIALPALGAVDISLPLEGYYRPGKYMPVRFAADAGRAGANAALLIQAEDSVPTRIDLSQGRSEGVAPLLPLDATPRQLTWQAQGREGTAQQPLRPLGADQRLVAFLSVDLEFAQRLFPGKAIIPIRLDPSAIMPGPPAAWQALDAIVLDAASAGQLDARKIASILAGGTVIAVRSATAPSADWPWNQVGDYWVLSCETDGPRTALSNPLAFSPVQGWDADWPPALRRRVFLYALVFSIVILGAALLKLKHSAIIGVGISAVAVLLLAWWWSGRSAVLQRTGEIMIVGDNLAQSDLWIYRASARAVETFVPWSRTTWPLFEAKADCETTRTTLLCRGDGEPAGFSAICAPPLRLAFLSRSISPATSLTATRPVENNPLALLAQRLYLRPQTQVLGQLPAHPSPHPESSEFFPAIILKRSEAQTAK